MKLKFWPYDTFVIETSETRAGILEKLRKHVGSGPFFPWSKQGKEFVGTVNETGFKIYRAIRYHNSFLPVLIGDFEQRPEGTHVNVRMRLHGYTLGFMVVFIFFVAKFTVDLIGPHFQFDAAFFWGLGVPATIILAIYLMTILGFSYEADRSRELAFQILTGRPSNKALQTDAYGRG